MTEENHKEGSRSNIARHYDLSNGLFANFLDSTMTYSAADFGGERPGFEALADAQRRKIERVLDFAGVRSGMRILEIGTFTGYSALAMAEARPSKPEDKVTAGSAGSTTIVPADVSSGAMLPAAIVVLAGPKPMIILSFLSL